MKVLVVHPGPAWATADVHRGWLRGLHAAGARVESFNLDDRLRAYETAHIESPTGEFVRSWPDDSTVVHLAGFGLLAKCFQFWPDLVLVISGAILYPDVYDCIRARGIKVAILHTESPYEDDRQLVIAEHADINLLNDPTNIERYLELGAAVAYVPHAYDPDVHRPGPSRFDLDVAWVGTAGNTFPGRTRFLEQVDFGSARVGLGGLWDGIDDQHPLHRHLLRPDTPVGCVDNDDTAEIYRGSKMGFNLYRTEGDQTDDTYMGGWAMGPREVELAATGTFFARHRPDDHGGEGDQVLSMLPTFSDPAELGEIVSHYLANDDTRERLAIKARAAVGDRTFEQHAHRLLEQIPTPTRAAAH